MDPNHQLAFRVAERILKYESGESGLPPNCQVLLDLTEMVRQQIRGDHLLGEMNLPLPNPDFHPGNLQPAR